MSRFVKWPDIDGPLNSLHPFWDREEQWVESYSGGWRRHHSNIIDPEVIWWREKLHFPFKNRHQQVSGPRLLSSGRNGRPVIPAFTTLPNPMNIFELPSPFTQISPNTWRNACLIQFGNQGTPDLWMKSDRGKIVQGQNYWSLRGVSNTGNYWMAIGFYNSVKEVTFQDMGFIFSSGEEYLGNQAYDMLLSQYSNNPVAINYQNL